MNYFILFHYFISSLSFITHKWVLLYTTSITTSKLGKESALVLSPIKK